MEAQRRIKRSLDAIDDAVRKLKRAKSDAEYSDDLQSSSVLTNINRAIRELSDAQDDLRRALREIS